MGNSLEAPLTEKHSEIFQSHSGIIVGSSGMQGWRLEMEDSHVACNIPSKPDHLFLAVFDGHGGDGAAKYAAENIVKFLQQSVQWEEYLKGDCTDTTLLGNAMIVAFTSIDLAMREFQIGSSGTDISGCTAVTAIVTPKYIICANAGDSRCVLGTKGIAIAMSEDHKPSNAEEKKRIEKAEGYVQYNRVDGELAVSRALGDFSFKNPQTPALDQKISCYPDISVHERTDADEVLILACDGLWDVMSSTESIDTIREILSLGEESVPKIAEEMLDIALIKGSKDNISAVIAKFSGAKVGPLSGGGVDKLRAQRAVQNESKIKNSRIYIRQPNDDEDDKDDDFQDNIYNEENEDNV